MRRADGQGAMLAVLGTIDEVSTLVRDHALDVVIANKNAPRQCVLSGPATNIEHCRRILAERKISSQLLPVSAAFHSPAVAGVEGAFASLLESISFAPAEMPVFANPTAEPYPTDAAAARAALASQLRGRSSLWRRSRPCTAWAHARSSKSAPTPS